MKDIKPNTLKILFITSRADIGGGPKHLFLLASRLSSMSPNTNNACSDISKKNVTPMLYIASPSEEPFGPLFKQISEHIEIPKRKFSLTKLIHLVLLCGRKKITIVHSHGFGAGLYSRPLFFLGIKVIHTFHGIHLTKGILGKVKLVINKLLLGLTHKCICVSDDERKKACKLLNLNPSKIVVIYNGLDISAISKVDKHNKEYLRKTLSKNHQQNKLIIGTLCRFDYQKGLDILLNYIYKYKTSHKALPFDLYIAGDGEDKDILQNQRDKLGLQDNVIFLGNTDESYLLLKSLNLFVSTSRCEGMPYSVLEAMALNIPVLLSDVTGHRVFGKHNLFDLESFESFETKLNIKLEAIKRKDVVNNEEFFEKFFEKFSIDTMVNETLNLYKTVTR